MEGCRRSCGKCLPPDSRSTSSQTGPNRGRVPRGLHAQPGQPLQASCFDGLLILPSTEGPVAVIFSQASTILSFNPPTSSVISLNCSPVGAELNLNKNLSRMISSSTIIRSCQFTARTQCSCCDKIVATLVRALLLPPKMNILDRLRQAGQRPVQEILQRPPRLQETDTTRHQMCASIRANEYSGSVWRETPPSPRPVRSFLPPGKKCKHNTGQPNDRCCSIQAKISAAPSNPATEESPYFLLSSQNFSAPSTSPALGVCSSMLSSSSFSKSR